ncbi:MAG: NAD(P)-dependent oxidoreductase [Patescibacteria group bacterium]|nr:NAD(P)-dependent oxidoreductase [Patescibacteria group bacterium]MDE2015268.1 NAD(P)-dependent oxidoreductase [Patescibacteria group bacterium]MDE2227074.1 NAD(P)-dependent oxidoreductase [Patescibacteria group bacterium]
MPKTKVIVTGAAGFIGSWLARTLVASGEYEVNVIVRPASDTRRIKDIWNKVNVYEGNLLDKNEIAKIVAACSPRGVFHLAASNIMSGKTAPDEEVLETNVLGTINVMNAAHDNKCNFFVQTGTFTEYGKKNSPLKETDPSEPADLYSITKLMATLYGKGLARASDLHVVTLRIFTPYGPDIQKGRLVYNLIEQALKNGDLNLTNPKVSRDFIFVEDLVKFIIEAGEKAEKYGGEIFNAGTGVKTMLGEIAELVIKLTNSKSKVVAGKLESVPYDSEFWQADMEKTYKNFQWRPAHSLEQGLLKTIEWFKNSEI